MPSSPFKNEVNLCHRSARFSITLLPHSHCSPTHIVIPSEARYLLSLEAAKMICRAKNSSQL